MLLVWLTFVCLTSSFVRGDDPANTAYVNPAAREGGDGSSQRPFGTIKQAVLAGLNQPPSATTWTILLRQGTYQGAGQVEIAIRDTKRFIFFFENRGVSILCDRADFFLDYTGLGGRGGLVVLGNGGMVADCQDSAIRSQRRTSISSIRFVRNRALLWGSAVRVATTGDALAQLDIEGCSFEDQLQRPIDSPSSLNHQGGGAVWATGVPAVRITESQFVGNEASQGGGVYLANCASVTIRYCSFERNWALLDSVGGGGAAVVCDVPNAAPCAVTVHDSTFVSNLAGGAAAGLYVGGRMSLNLTRVTMANNTSDAASLDGSPSLSNAGGGVGLLVYGAVSGTLTNVSLTDNQLTDSTASAGESLNAACSGATLGHNCVLLWNGLCDLCRRKLVGVELTLASQPCSQPTILVFTMSTLVFALLVVGVVVAFGGGLLAAALIVRHWRRKRRAAAEAAAVAAGGPGGDGSIEMLSLHKEEDEEDGEDEDCHDFDGELEPPCYGAGMSGASEEVLPSSDFYPRAARRAAAAAAAVQNGTSFKEVAYDELQIEGEPIGSGAFGLVYRAVWRGSIVAVKKYIGTLDDEGVQAFRAEAQLLHEIGNHPNVIKLFGACTVGPHYCLVVPYYRRGSVRDFLRTLAREELTWPFLTALGLQVAAGMIHLHRENLVHRDLAARNILVGDDGTARITDFGLARFVLHAGASGQTDSNVGAVAWMSPEAVAKRRYSKKSDVWSFGCTLWELCVRELPFAGVEPIHVAVRVAAGATLSVPEWVPPELAGVMRACWAPAPSDRPSFEELYALLKSIMPRLPQQ
jgi:hypothetical protein